MTNLENNNEKNYPRKKKNGWEIKINYIHFESEQRRHQSYELWAKSLYLLKKQKK